MKTFPMHEPIIWPDSAADPGEHPAKSSGSGHLRCPGASDHLRRPGASGHLRRPGASGHLSKSLCSLCSMLAAGILCGIAAPNAVAGSLIVDGAPFEVRGVCYQLAPVGRNPSQSPPFGDYFTSNYSAIYERDLANLRALGANVVRVYGWDTTADHGDFLDQCWNGGVEPIRVLVNRWINPQTNWSNATAVAAIAAEFTSIDTRLGSHPAVLGIILGNETNAQNGNGTNAAFWTAMNTVAGAIKAQTPSRPVSVAITDALPQVAANDAALTNIDFWSIQVYRGLTFGVFFNQYAAASSKPLIVTEFGVDAYDAAAGAPYPNDRAFVADALEGLWGELAANAAVAAGACVFEYVDEWWKSGSATVHDTGGFALGGLPDGFANEEWWGLFSVTPATGGGLDTLTPRAAYARLQSLWKPVVSDPPAITVQPISQSLDAGGPVSLLIEVDGTGPFSYQWQLNGVDIAGATAATYALPSAQNFHAGDYRVVVTNSAGSVTSAAASLVVQTPPASAARLLNLSTRGFIGPGTSILIPGFVVSPEGPKTFLLRVVGPALAAFGVGNALADPKLTVFAGGTALFSNDDWDASPDAARTASVAVVVGAFDLAPGSKDAALVATLQPGAYTVHGFAADGTSTGSILVEVYEEP